MRAATVLSLVLPLVYLSHAQHAEIGDLDPHDGFDEDEFLEYFGKAPIDDPEVKKARSEALKKHEKEIKELNEKYQRGEISWFDGVNEFADLTDDEFLAKKTGANLPKQYGYGHGRGLLTDLVDMQGKIKIPTQYGRGLLEPTEEERVDEASERYFDQFRSINRASVPSSFSSVDNGYVSPVRNQMQCGSCVAFASMAAVEVCFKKAAGEFGDYSEQQFVDCGYQQNGANGCNGAPPHAYLKWAADSKLKLAHESEYEYTNTNPTLTCPANLPVYNQGVDISDSWYTYSGSEDLMQQMVYEHGAVVGAVRSAGPFQEYQGGIFGGCPDTAANEVDHAITVVGYGTDNGQDYWLIKNSWGPNWGENGFIRIERGVNMCGIGYAMATVSCESVAGPTDAPMTTMKPCEDKYGNCDTLAQYYCYHTVVAEGCPKSCNLC